MKQLEKRGIGYEIKSPGIDGKFISVGGERFWIRGVTYGSFAPNEEGEPFPPFYQLCEDFARMVDVGINTVRLYAPPSDRIANEAARVGLYLIPDICWGPRWCELDNPERVKYIFDWTRRHARRLTGHPAMLINSIGNEIPPLMVRWYGRKRIENFLRTLCETVKEQAPNSLVTYITHPPTEYLNLPFLDVISFNVYLESEVEFRKYLARLQMLAGNKPLFLAEIGLDSSKHGEEQQAEVLRWQLQSVQEKGLCGAAVYSWTDEWSIFENEISGWAFGLTDRERREKPSLEAVRQIYTSNIYDLRQKSWPKVSVVVASYNGGKTLSECLESLERLNYPNYEIIVIDDGSTDATAQIVKEHDVHYIYTANGGLSRARNLGIQAASGSVIAFTDSDASVDPDWLYFMVIAMEEQNASGVGGPNLAPPQDGFVADCVDHAPGNPTHVLFDDELAEHIAGCNMAFRKETLEAIGLFDPTHRSAGDDVDVCWKLLARREKIAFSPSAIVWHHRRSTVNGYWRQQRGYGFAEAYLRSFYPGRFNIFGDLVWKGRIYDSPHTALRTFGVPSLFKPRIYQGWFGSGLFQSIYQPFLSWWLQIFTTAEWQLLSWFILATGVLSIFINPIVGYFLLPLSVMMITVSLGIAVISGIHAAWIKRWTGWQRVKGTGLVAWLHITQPLIRAVGMVEGWLNIRSDKPAVHTDRRVWGNLEKRQIWLETLLLYLQACGWKCRPSEEWGDTDIDILGPGPHRLQLCSTYEENLEKNQHFVRFRIKTRWKRTVPLLWFMISLALISFIAFPYLLPLAPVFLYFVRRLWRTKYYMIAGVSQIAIECAGGLDMPEVKEY